MANSSVLHLVIEKGPKQGETLMHKSGTLIRIGRVVKGNTFAIKDPGISQKHLSIEFICEISKWAVKDLDTSNGTLVNDVKIPPLTPFPLSSGDTVKIGEMTSIAVIVDSIGNESEDGVKKGRRRGMATRALVEEEKCVEEVKNLEFGRSRRGISSRASKKDEILDVVDDNVKIRSRRGNSSRVSEKDEILNAVVEESVQLRPKRGASSRVSKKEETLGDPVDESIKLRPTRGNSSRALKKDEDSNAVVDLSVQLRSKRGASSGVSKQDETLDDPVDDSIKLRPTRGNSSRAMRKDENSDAVVEGSVGVRLTRAGLRIRANELPVEKEKLMENANIDVHVEENIELPKGVRKGRSKKAPARTRASPAKVLPSGDKGEANGENREIGVEEEKELDLEKMTLGEWFDSMKKYLPNEVNEAAEQMIESLYERARRFDEDVTNISNGG